MHQTLRIPEILLNIFRHILIPSTGSDSPHEGQRHDNADLAVLARTCRAFKEPALDVLWEELLDLSPLVRCIPDACRLSATEKPLRTDPPYYVFSRPLSNAEWNTLRGYTYRVRFIRGFFEDIHTDTMKRILSVAPFDGPLFPHLRSLYWNGTGVLPSLHVAVSSLKTLHTDLHDWSFPTVDEFFSAFGDNCRHIENFVLEKYPPEHSPNLDSIISRAVCRWPKLQGVICPGAALSVDAISYLSSAADLDWLEFTVVDDLILDIARLHSNLVFSNVKNLIISSRHLDTITSLLRHVRLPKIEALGVATQLYISRQAIQAFWEAVEDVCPSDVLSYIKLDSFIQNSEEVSLDEEEFPHLTLDDLRPCTALTELRGLDVDLDLRPVDLTDADLLELVSPRMEHFLINYSRGWQTNADNGGITLSGLVQLLRQCPSLNYLCIAINTRTFTKIPDGLDVSFPPRKFIRINLADSYILPEFVPGLVSVFAALGLDRSMLGVGSMTERDPVERDRFNVLWDRVLDELKDASRT